MILCVAFENSCLYYFKLVNNKNTKNTKTITNAFYKFSSIIMLCEQAYFVPLPTSHFSFPELLNRFLVLIYTSWGNNKHFDFLALPFRCIGISKTKLFEEQHSASKSCRRADTRLCKIFKNLRKMCTFKYEIGKKGI